MEVQMMTWLDDICNVLLNPKFAQIQGNLELRTNGEITGKCALGELRCGKNVDSVNITDDDNRIMGAFGVPSDLFGKLPRLNRTYVGKAMTGGNNFEDPRFEDLEMYGDGIANYIWQLNDCGFTYPQIVAFLKETFGDCV